jgi:hypothetical protein
MPDVVISLPSQSKLTWFGLIWPHIAHFALLTSSVSTEWKGSRLASTRQSTGFSGDHFELFGSPQKR